MKYLPPFLVLVLFALITTGCQNSSALTRPAFVALEQDSTVTGTESAQVFVEGRERGTTPGMLYVRRGFGEHEITLQKDGEVVRQFFAEQTYSTQSAEANFSLGQRTSGDTPHFYVIDLNVSSDGTVMIPYLDGSPVTVSDRKYGLTMVIQE